MDWGVRADGVWEVESNVLYVFGSLQRGRLGLPSVYAPSERDDGDVEPELHVLAKATEVIVPPELGGIESIAVGFEHLLVLSSEYVLCYL